MSPSSSMNTFHIDLLNDLQDGSHLAGLLASSGQAIFGISTELAKFAGDSVSAAAGAAPARITLDAPLSWTTSSGIAFSLAPEANCTVCVDHTSTNFALAAIDDSAPASVVAGPTDGKVYINIDLDFSIQGSVSGGGTASGVGISGAVSGSKSATFSYCHAVDGSLGILEALKSAFSALVLPFEPDAALKMAPGDVARVCFDGSLSIGFNVTYGLGSFQFSAPGVAAVQKSLQAGVLKLNLPKGQVDCGATGSVKFQHTDHFAALIRKTGDATAVLYVVRAAADEIGASVGLTVGLTATSVETSLDQDALAKAVNGITGGSGGEKAAALADQARDALTKRVNDWLSTPHNSGIQASIARQTGRAILYEFEADLTNSDVIKQSWKSLAAGDLAEAARLQGLKLLPGSGVANELKRSVTLGIHFFNFASVDETEIYFQKASTAIGPDGHIRFLFDTGREQDIKTKSALETSRIHFMASANQVDPGHVAGAVVDLVIELTAVNKPKDGHAIAAVIGPLGIQIQPAEDQIGAFLAAHGGGTLTLAIKLHSAAYGKLAASDQDNWKAYRDAVRSSFDLQYVDRLRYADWEAFNVLCTGAQTPDRREAGNQNAVPPSFYSDRGVGAAGTLAGYFLASSAHFMNLCDGLHVLAGALPEIDTGKEWDSLLDDLTALAKNLQMDWSRPSTRAILALCGAGSPVDVNVQAGDSKLTCTVTVG